MSTICGAGDPKCREGVVVYIYTCNQSMTNKCMYNGDGDFLIGKVTIVVVVVVIIVVVDSSTTGSTHRVY